MKNSASDQSRIRFGVMTEGNLLRAWEFACIESVLSIEGVRLALMIVHEADPPARKESELRRLWSRHLLYDVYRRHLFRPPAMEPVDARPLFGAAPRLACKVDLRGHSQYFSPPDIAKIREARLDFILRFGFNIIRGDVLTAARFGIWSFHHDDEERYRGQPACFWEIYHGDPVTGSILQRLTERLDAGVILRKGYFKTLSYSFVTNREQALVESAQWPASVCRDIQHGRTEYIDGPPSTTEAPILRKPTNGQMLRFAGTLVRRRLEAHIQRRWFREVWNVGFVRRPITSFLTSPPAEIEWYPDDSDAWFADPFGLATNGRTEVLCERFDDDLGRGAIWALTLRDGAWVAGSKVVLPLDAHASYPFLLEHDGAVYMIPEMHTTEEIALFRASEFPSRWEKIATLVEGVAGIDPTVIRHQGRWWLFFGERRRALSIQSLFIYYASELFGPWLPHVRNPVKLDVRSSRPAGTPFVRDGELYRPAQDCSRTYGGRIVLNRVTRLTPEEFAEEPVAFVEPVPGSRFRHGVHTLTSLGDEATLVDGKRFAIRLPFRRAQLEP